MKVAFVSGVNSNLDAVRGIGAHNSELFKQFEKLKTQIEIVDSTKKADVTHITKFHPFFISLPFIKPSKKVVLTIHDLIQLIYPKHYPPGLKGRINFLINKFLIWKNVDAIITISETSKKDICRFLRVQPDKVHVIYLAAKKIFKPIANHQSLITMRRKYNLPDSFALYVGDVNYNKNIPGLIEMCKEVKISLVIVGKQAYEIRDKDRELNHPELNHLKNLDWSNVITLGFVPDEDLVVIYNLCDVYVQPSFYEGFALPILEARACGAWVIATRIQAHVEIMEGDRSYSWEKTAKETLEVYGYV
ncbi:MAG: glycosyltransferase family 1 protein [Patescibacteria group bacterium]